MADTKRKYPIGYRPIICTVNCTMKYYNKKFHKFLIDKKTANRYQDKISTVDIKEEQLVLDDEKHIPTANIKERFIGRMWRDYGMKGKRKEFNVGIRDIEVVHSHTRVSYNFDETKH